MHKEKGGEEKEASCVIIPSCTVAAARRSFFPCCWEEMLGRWGGGLLWMGQPQTGGKMELIYARTTGLV